MTRTQFTISEASRITGKSRTTLRSYLKKGSLSSVKGHGDQRLIDASELTRRFGNDLDFSLADPETKRPASSKSSSVVKSGQSGRSELQQLQQQLEREMAQRTRDRERFEQEIDQLHGVLKRTQEGHAKAMLLIESRTDRAGDWEQPLQDLQSQVTRFEKEQTEIREAAKRKINRLQRELEAERSKSFLARLFGDRTPS